MKRGYYLVLVLVFIISFASSAENLCLDKVGWDVTSIHSGTDFNCWAFSPASGAWNAHDNSYDTYSMGCEYDGDWRSYVLQLTFPEPISMSKVNYTYRLIMVYYPSASSGENATTKLEVYSGGAWTEASNCEVLFESPYNHPTQLYARFGRECTGNWNNVERIRLTVSGYFGVSGGWDGAVMVEEIGAYDETSCVPNCTGKECGDNGCEGSCGNCDTLYPDEGRICSEGTCLEMINHPCPSSNDTIMKLYSDTNTHGTLWNGTGYNYSICYSDIFGSSYIGVNPHSCNGYNKVVGLSNVTNAHAEVPSLDNYGFPVCYGNLVCAARDSCLSNERLVVSLSENTNAQLSGLNDYPIKICCKSSEEYSAFWTNLLDESITNTEIGDLVKLGVSGSDMAGEIEYEIYRVSSSWWWPFDKRVAQTSSLGYTFWRAGMDEEGNLVSGNYYFNAKLSNGIATSGELEVTEPLENSPPKVKIVSPSKDSKFELGETISFIAEFEDEDDDLRAIWDFGDGKPTITRNNCLTTGNCNVDYTYSESQAAYVITVLVEEMGRTGTAKNYTRVLVYDENLNLFSIIDEPEFGKRFDEKSMISFDASNSFASNCTTLSTCNFPSPPTGESAITNCYSVGGLHCYDYPKEWINDYYDLYFNWTFSEGEPRSGSWSADYGRVVEFSKLFIQPKSENHWAKLRLGFDI
ncbi:MAG: hypothetical protein WC494_00335 [Candidatus Pacearchaeota archaeon]